VTEFAGRTNCQGFAEGMGKQALFNSPGGISVDAHDNIYIADGDNNRIRKVTPQGEVTTFAGTGTAGCKEGPVDVAQFNRPVSVSFDKHGNMFVGDQYNHRIRKITPEGIVSTLAGSYFGCIDGVGSRACFTNPVGISSDRQGNIIVGDTGNHRIRKVFTDGRVITIAGTGKRGLINGEGRIAQFKYPAGTGADIFGNILVADQDNRCIRIISRDFKADILVGNVEGSTNFYEHFENPIGIFVDVWGNIYVTDSGDNRIHKIQPLYSIAENWPKTQNVLPLTCQEVVLEFLCISKVFLHTHNVIIPSELVILLVQVLIKVWPRNL